MRGFSPEVRRKLGHYVYLYIDPLSDEVFYVGKGVGDRAFSHLDDRSDSEKWKRIRSIRRAGREPSIELLAHGLDGRTADRLEAAAIDVLDKQKLTNVVSGKGSGVYGRMTVEQVRAHYSGKEVKIKHPCILIRINRLFRYGLTPVELYDATRGIWRVGPEREKATFALAVFGGVVQEVYQITAWFRAGSTLSSREGDFKARGRWEFVGRLAPPEVRNRYRLKSVRRIFPQGAQNPIRYFV